MKPEATLQNDAVSAIIPDLSMGPVHLRVRDLARALDFYKGMLGMRVLRQSGGFVELGADAPIIRLTGDADAPPRPPRSPGLYHVAILLPSRAQLARILEHFSVFRQPLEGAADHLVSEALYLSDPEGNGIEIYADRPRETWTWNDGRLHMTTAVLDIEGLLKEAGDEAWNGLPEGTRVGHVHLQVGFVPQALTFYRDLLGLDLTTTYGQEAIFLSAGGYHHHVAANAWGTQGALPAPDGVLGLIESTLILPGREVVDAAGARLATYVESHEENGDVVVRDPSGNRLRLTAA